MPGNRGIKEEREGPGAPLVVVTIGTKEAKTSLYGRGVAQILASQKPMPSNGALFGAVRARLGESLLKEFDPKVGSGRNKRGEFHWLECDSARKPVWRTPH